MTATLLALAVASTPGQTLTWVRSVDFHPSGKYVASGGDDERIKVWDAGTGRLLRSWRAHRSHVTAVSYSRDGRRLASSGADGLVIVWDPATGRALRRIRTGTSYTSDSQFGPGNLIASAGYDNRAKLWNAATGRLVRSFSGLQSDAYCVALSRDGRLIAAGGPDKTLRVWDARTGRLRQTIRIHQVMEVAFSPSGQHVAIDGAAEDVLLYDVETGRLSQRLPILDTRLPNPVSARSFRFSPDGASLAVGDSAGRVLLLSLAAGEDAVLLGHREEVAGLAFSRDGRRLASGSYDSTVRIWDVRTRRLLRTLGTPKPAL